MRDYSVSLGTLFSYAFLPAPAGIHPSPIEYMNLV